MANVNENKLSDAYLEHLIQDIETTDTPLGPAYKILFDHGYHKAFVNALQIRIKSLDKEIEKLCSYYYQGFTESIHELPRIRNDLSKLKNELIDTNSQLQYSGKSLINKLNDSVKHEKITKNIESAIKSTNSCLPVQQQIKDKRYYAALKTLEFLERSLLQRIHTFDLGRALQGAIHDVRSRIKVASEKQLTDFLDIVRQKSLLVGQAVMESRKYGPQKFDLESLLDQLSRYMPKESETFHEKLPSATNNNPFANDINGKNPFSSSFDHTDDIKQRQNENNKSIYPNNKPMPNTLENELSSVSDSDQFMLKPIDPSNYIDFSLIYRCLHINTILGEKEVYFEHYRKQRQKQIKLILQPLQTNESFESYQTYLNEIVGFFVIEDYIYNHTRKVGLINRSYMDELWENTATKIISLLKTKSAYTTDATLMLDLKNLIVNFSLTMKDYGFVVNRMSELLLEIRDQYQEIIRSQLVQNFHHTLSMDVWDPITFNNPTQFTDYVRDHQDTFLNAFCQLTSHTIIERNKNNPLFALKLSNATKSSATNNNNNITTTMKLENTDNKSMKDNMINGHNGFSDNHTTQNIGPQNLNANMTALGNSSSVPLNIKLELPTKYPCFLPFSYSLPMILEHFKSYILTCLTFMKDLPNLSVNELEDALKKSLNNLITRCLAGCFSTILKRNDLSINQCIQIGITMQYIEVCIPMIEDFIVQSVSKSPPTNTLNSITSNPKTPLLKEIIEETESKTKQEISNLITSILLNAKIDWMCNITTKFSQPFTFITSLENDLSRYLFTYPNTYEPFFKQTFDYSFQYLAHSLLGLLITDKTRMFSHSALQYFQWNLAHLIENYNSIISKNEDLKNLNVFRHFREINQLLNLIIKIDWSTYITEHGNPNSPYSHVSSKLASLMLERLMLGEKQRDNLLTNMTAKKSDKRKINENLLKQLKQINNEPIAPI